MSNAHSTPFFPLTGGLDLSTPAVSTPPGRAIAALNYVPVASGYRRIKGYERFDGSASPSVTSFFTLPVRNLLQLPQPGWEMYEGTVNADAHSQFTVISAALLTGALGGANTASLVVAYSHRGPTVNSVGAIYRRLNGANTLIGSLDGAPVPLAGDDLATAAAAAPAVIRPNIGAVPGSGPVRFVFPLGGRLYAIRDTADGTAAAIFSTGRINNNGYVSDGWQAVPLGHFARFDQGGIDGKAGTEGGVYDPTSGFGGVGISVNRIVVTSGSWEEKNAAGYLVANQPIGAQGGYLYDSNSDHTLRVMRISSPWYANTLPPGGTYRSVRYNFYGAANLTRLYVVSGKGPAFELGSFYESNGSVEVLRAIPILTGMADDRPTHIAVHSNHLFLAFRGGSLQFSSPGEPLVFDPIVGAGEIGIGDQISTLVTTPNSLAIMGENTMHMLYGHDASDFQLETLTRDAGALPFSARSIGQIYYMDNRGIRTLSTTQAFGNFNLGTISHLIAPLLEDKRIDGVNPVAAFVSRPADQYWICFADGTGIVGYMGKKHPEFLPFSLGKVISYTTSVEDGGEERIYFGATDGFVYELNRGTSFDGQPIGHYIRLPFNHFGSPQQKKRAHKVIVDLEAEGPTTLSITVDYDYGQVQGSEPQTLLVTTGAPKIYSPTSSEMYFNSQIETVAEAYIDGVFKNVSLLIGGSSATEKPHTLTGVTYHITARGQQR